MLRLSTNKLVTYKTGRWRGTFISSLCWCKLSSCLRSFRYSDISLCTHLRIWRGPKKAVFDCPLGARLSLLSYLAWPSSDISVHREISLVWFGVRNIFLITYEGHPARSSQRFTSPGAGDGGPTLAERVARHHGRRLDRVSGQCASSNMSFVRNQEHFYRGTCLSIVCLLSRLYISFWRFSLPMER